MAVKNGIWLHIAVSLILIALYHVAARRIPTYYELLEINDTAKLKDVKVSFRRLALLVS